MKVKIMGIVNVTDDSFYEASRCMRDGSPDVQEVVRRVETMLREGADIIDVGACSTRPGSESVSAEEEWRRLEPVLRAVWTACPDVLLSVDTFRASVVEKVYGLAEEVLGDISDGAGGGSGGCELGERVVNQFIVNDISAGEDDTEMLPLVGRLGLTYIAMHKRGKPSEMQKMCDYEDVVEDVLKYFVEFGAKAERFGVKDWILDPGFGFAKTLEQNYLLLRELRRFTALGRPVLVGVSRKSMIYRLHGITPEESLAQTQVLHYEALRAGAAILRVHDVAEAVRTVKTCSFLR